jgi:hypothetical protein
MAAKNMQAKIAKEIKIYSFSKFYKIAYEVDISVENHAEAIYWLGFHRVAALKSDSLSTYRGLI